MIHIIKYGHYFSHVWQSYIKRNLDHLLTVCRQWVTLWLLISGPMLKRNSCSFSSQSCSTLLDSNCSVSPHTSPECHTHIHHSYVRHMLLETDKHLFGCKEKDIFVIGDGVFLWRFHQHLALVHVQYTVRFQSLIYGFIWSSAYLKNIKWFGVVRKNWKVLSNFKVLGVLQPGRIMYL